MGDDDLHDKIARIGIEELAKRAEDSQALDRYAGPNESLTFIFLIEKLRDEAKLVQHLAGALQRIDELARDRDVDRAKLAVVVADAAETRRLTMAAVDRVNTLAQVVGAGMDEIARVSKASEEQGKALRVQAELAAAEAKELAERTEALRHDVEDRD